MSVYLGQFVRQPGCVYVLTHKADTTHRTFFTVVGWPGLLATELNAASVVPSGTATFCLNPQVWVKTCRQKTSRIK